MIINNETKILNLNDLKIIIEQNKNLIIIFFKANWCNPCKKIIPLINYYLQNNNIKSYIIDIDESIDIYTKLKKYRILTGVPSLFCYEPGILDFFPSDAVFGSNETDIIDFFERCNIKKSVIESTL